MYEKIVEILSKQLQIDQSKISENSGIMENLGADSTVSYSAVLYYRCSGV